MNPIDCSSGDCFFHTIVVISVLIIFLGLSSVNITQRLFLQRYRKYSLLGLSFFLLVALFSSENVRDVFTAFGPFCAALFALWREDVLAWLNPVRLDIEIECEKDPDDQIIGGRYYDMYHMRVANLNPGRIAKGVTVTFSQFSLDGKRKHVSVSRQLTWAPHEIEKRLTDIANEKTLDLLYRERGKRSISLVVYSGENFSFGEGKFHDLKNSEIVLYLRISALNMPKPVWKALRVGYDHPTCPNAELVLQMTDCSRGDWIVWKDNKGNKES